MDNKEYIEFLKNSLIYQMSLGARELYHSNLWAWLIEMDHRYANAFIPKEKSNEFSNYNVVGVDREYSHRDLIIWLEDNNKNKYYIVIENKIKSLPTLGQLKKYSENINKDTLLFGLLTGIVENKYLVLPKEIKQDGKDKGYSWYFLDYERIANNIKRITDEITSDNEIIKDKANIIYEYVKVVETINLLLKDNLNKNPNKLIYNNDLSDKYINLNDIALKLKGNDFYNELFNHIEEFEKIGKELEPYGFVLWTNIEFNNGKVTIDVRFSSRDRDNSHYLLMGVQIESNQYRLVAEMAGNKSQEEVYDYYKDGWFDDNYQKDKTILGKITSFTPRQGKYNSYKTKNYTFIYQYYDICEKNKNLDYNALIDNIKSDLIKAKNLLIEKAKDFYK